MPTAFLVGMMFAAMALTMTATVPSIGAINNFYTLFILPMFYLTGVFFPTEGLPGGIRQLAWLLPLTPATALTRSLIRGQMTGMVLLWLVHILLVMAVAFTLAVWALNRRLMR